MWAAACAPAPGKRTMMLSRLRIGQRVTLVQIVAIVVVVFAGVPFVVARIDANRAIAEELTAARRASAAIGTVHALQRERLLMVAATTEPATVDRRELQRLLRRVDATLGSAEPVGDRAARQAVRVQALTGSLPSTEISTVYTRQINAVVDGLVLPGALPALRDLLRLGEERARIGVGLMLAATEPLAAGAMWTDARSGAGHALERVRPGAVPPLAEALDAAVTSASARQLETFGARLPDSGPTVSRLWWAANADLAGWQEIQASAAARTVDALAERLATARPVAYVAAAVVVGVLALVAWLGVAVTRSVAAPLRQLTAAASQVANIASQELVRVSDEDAMDSGPPKLAAVTIRGDDDISELAAAFNRVQATAALLMDRQVTMRRNVAVMFANIGYRTRSLVTRQLALVDALERVEQDERLLGELYRLDHLTTRLRRGADSLIVISGSNDDQSLPEPARLPDVIRAATSEIEGFQRVRLGAVAEVVIAPSLVGDLTLLLAELLENATAASPPGTPVQVGATVGAACEVTIVDHGIGMTAARLAEENRRLVSRERIDLAPTTMLGLFVVGRLVRRHGLSATLDHTPGDGVTATVRIPAALYTDTNGHAPPPRALTASIGRATVASTATLHLVPPSVEPSAPEFGWFGDEAHKAPAGPDAAGPDAGPDGAAPDGPASAVPPARPVLPAPDVPAYQGAPPHQAAPAVRAEVLVLPPSRGGLQRRRPGQHLAAALRDDPALAAEVNGRAAATAATRQNRDAQAERAAIEGFVAGFSRVLPPPEADTNRS